MNNLSENQRNAKQAFLDNQQNEMLSRYKTADSTERAAIIRQIDGFLPTHKGDEKQFWLSFRQKLERIGDGKQNVVLTGKVLFVREVRING
jgi:hypothetical protein